MAAKATTLDPRCRICLRDFGNPLRLKAHLAPNGRTSSCLRQVLLRFSLPNADESEQVTLECRRVTASCKAAGICCIGEGPPLCAGPRLPVMAGPIDDRARCRFEGAEVPL